MTPTKFHASEATFTHPAEHIGDLPVLRTQLHGSPALVSCWEPTDSERAAIAAGGPVFLVIMGAVQPPVIVTAHRSDLGI